MNQSKTIRVLLCDGNPQGIRTAEIGNHIVKAVVVPRTRLKEAGERSELHDIGLYFLIGEQFGDEPSVYIGEAENVYKRLLQHNSDENKDFWNIAVCFLTSNSSFTKAHVKYLEGCVYGILKSTGRVSLENGSVPAVTSLPEMDRADASNFYNDLVLLMGVLGYQFFQQKRQPEENRKIYVCKGPDADGKGVYTDEGFVVLKGSLARINPSDSAKERYLKLRPVLLNNGTIKPFDDKSFIFMEDYIFNSPSAAAQNILARNANGWTEWVDDGGKTLDEIIRKEPQINAVGEDYAETNLEVVRGN